MFPWIHSQVDNVPVRTTCGELGVIAIRQVVKSDCQVFQKSKLATRAQDEPAEEVVLIDVLVKQLKLDLLPGELRQNDLSHGGKHEKRVS